MVRLSEPKLAELRAKRSRDLAPKETSHYRKLILKFFFFPVNEYYIYQSLLIVSITVSQ